MVRIGTVFLCVALAFHLFANLATAQRLDQEVIEQMAQKISEHQAYEESVRLQLQNLASDDLIEATMQASERSRLHPFFQPIVANHRSEVPSITGIQIDEPVAGLSFDPNGELRYDAIVYATDLDQLQAAGFKLYSRVNDFATARLTASELSALASLPIVRYVDASDVSYPDMNVSLFETGAHLLHAGELNGTPYTGDGAIVVVFDTGIDITHPDFLDPNDPTKTIIEYIWDVTLTPQGAETSPPHACCSYGVEYSRAEIDAALAGDPNDVRSQDTNGHGTHVAGTTSSQGTLFPGIAPDATLIVVRGGVASFSLTNIVNGLHYLDEKINELGMPGVINLSLGGHSGAHDGTRADEVAMDNLSLNPGWIAVNSAGNDGGNPIHINGTIAPLSTESVSFNVAPYTPSGADADFFGFDLWFQGNDNVNLTVTTPNDESTQTWSNGQSFNENTDDGRVLGFNAVDVANNHRRLNFQVTDGGGIDPAEGMWQMNMENTTASTLEFDGWLYSRSSSMRPPHGNTTLVGGDSQMTLSMPATSNSVIVVGSYVTKWSWVNSTGGFNWYGSPNRTHDISTFSSHGPTRDGRMKPDIAAPGQGIAAARSSFAPGVVTVKGGQHYVTQGTSMAAPHVAGAVALMLGADPTLTYADVAGLLRDNSTRDAFTGPVENNTWGWGKMNVYRALADRLGANTSLNTDVISYHFRGDALGGMSGAVRWGTRFTPERSGIFSHVLLDVYAIPDDSDDLTVEIYDDNAGLPGSQLGSTVSVPVSDLLTLYDNAIDITAANVTITQGQDYHIVFGVTGDGNVHLLLDSGDFPTDRTTHYNGTSWAKFGDRFAGPVRNLHVRAVLQETETPLPVEIAALRAHADGNDAILEWVTHSEKNNAGFEIQHQRGGTFQTIAFVEGHGTTSESRAYSHRIKDLPPGSHTFRLRQVDFDGNASFAPTVEVFIELPAAYHLSGAYPNPFNPQTSFTLAVALEQSVTIEVHNVLGQRVMTLFDGRLEPNEVHTFAVDASGLPSGLYFYRVQGETFSDTKKMILAK